MTGLGQISAVNMETSILLAKKDLKMIESMNLYYYFYFIFKTFILTFKKKA